MASSCVRRPKRAHPYVLFGDNNGNYNPWTPAVGSCTLTDTAYSGASASGQAGTPLTLSFRVVSQPPLGRVGSQADAEEVGYIPIRCGSRFGSRAREALGWCCMI